MSINCKAIIFDLDGTLIDSAKDLQLSVNRIFAKKSWDIISEEKIASFIGNGLMHLIKCCLNEIGKQDLPENVQDELMVEIEQQYYDSCLTSTFMFDGIEAVVKNLYDLGYKLAVCTNKPVAISNKILSGLKLKQYFSLVVGGDSLDVRKPNSRVMQHVLDGLEVSKEMAIYVGDSVTDVNLTQQFDMPTFIVNFGYQHEPVQASKNVILLDKIHDILCYLDSSAVLVPEDSALKALLFDVDGTLACNEDLHLIAFNYAFAKHNIDWEWSKDLYKKLIKVTGGKERIKHYQEEYKGDDAPLSAEKIMEVHIEKNKHYSYLLEQKKVGLRFGILRILKDARRNNIRLAIVTTTSRSNALALLRSLIDEESIKWFEILVCGEDVVVKKPAADAYLFALNSMVISAKNCLAIEDSANGYLAAKASGIKSVITVNEYTVDDDFSDASLIVDTLGDESVQAKAIRNTEGLNLGSFVTLDLLRTYTETA